MKTTQEFSPLEQLSVLAKRCPGRGQQIFDELCREVPGLWSELVISAIAYGQLSPSEGAELLQVEEDVIGPTVENWLDEHGGSSIIVEHGLARLEGSGLAVWELIREYRKSNELDDVLSHFPSLTRGDLRSALQYAEAHPVEIEELIERFNARQEAKKAVYPFVQ